MIAFLNHRMMLCFAVLVVAAIFVLGCQNGSTQQTVLKLGHPANESDIWHRCCLHFAKLVETKSQGRIKVQVFPAEQLGKELEMIRSIKEGIMDMTISGESMQNWTPYAAFCGMPYLIDDLEHAREVLKSPIGDMIAQQIFDNVGLSPVSYFVRGPRNLTSNRPIKTPEDLQGLILRVPNVPVSVAAWEALGAKPTPMAFSEVFTGLQSGTIEAQENPLALIDSAGFHEVQEYVNETQHVVGWVYLLIGNDQFQKLSFEDQQALLEAGVELRDYHQTLFVEEELQLRKQLEGKGMTFVDVDLDAFQKKSIEAILNAIPEEIRPMYQRIKEVQVAQ